MQYTIADFKRCWVFRSSFLALLLFTLSFSNSVAAEDCETWSTPGVADLQVCSNDSGGSGTIKLTSHCDIETDISYNVTFSNLSDESGTKTNAQPDATTSSSCFKCGAQQGLDVLDVWVKSTCPSQEVVDPVPDQSDSLNCTGEVFDRQSASCTGISGGLGTGSCTCPAGYTLTDTRTESGTVNAVKGTVTCSKSLGIQAVACPSAGTTGTGASSCTETTAPTFDVNWFEWVRMSWPQADLQLCASTSNCEIILDFNRSLSSAAEFVACPTRNLSSCYPITVEPGLMGKTQLVPDEPYYRVRDTNCKGTGEYSPMPKERLGSTTSTASQGDFEDTIEVTWEEVPGADFYIVYRCDQDKDILRTGVGVSSASNGQCL